VKTSGAVVFLAHHIGTRTRAISVENGEISTRELQIGMRVSSSVGHDT